jgi:hypothetical protein
LTIAHLIPQQLPLNSLRLGFEMKRIKCQILLRINLSAAIVSKTFEADDDPIFESLGSRARIDVVRFFRLRKV